MATGEYRDPIAERSATEEATEAKSEETSGASTEDEVKFDDL